MAFNKRVMFGIDDVVSKVIEKLQDLLMPSGCICYFKRSTPPSGWTICDGSVVVMRDGSRITTPNLIGRYPLGATTDVGTAVSAGLPNIIGRLSSNNAYSSFGSFSTEGAFYNDSGKALRVFANGGAASTIYDAYFDASKGTIDTSGNYMSQSDSPYGKSNTITPPSVKLLPCMKL